MSIPDIELANGVKIPQVGLGVFQISDENEVVNSVKWAIEAGYRHIDTASFYDNEEAVGEGIIASGIDRSKLFVTTKVWNDIRTYDDTMAQFQRSLDKLKLDYLDLLLIHWPAPGYEETWRAMEDLYKDGKIKAIGVSNFQDYQIEQLMKTAKIKPMIDQIETHPFNQQDKMHEFLKKENIVHEAWSPLGGGKNSVLNNEIVKKIADVHNKSVAQVVLRWHIQRGEVIIPKSIHQNRIEQNIDIFDFALTDDDMKKIATLNEDKRVGSSPDNKEWLEKSKEFNTLADRIKKGL
ncbi:aldo/keto reductase [Companilactobacillus keshanensis]|uniref:Aldo/keto reductase n=1 Tax=Companilactobacillus keshanensis TaxID=2486003 RepID=A0ABW4BRN9_9LACO|nr:aldo/keto reductase [Companilactobacillus keshanensis]